jgi:hypothetical protein
VDAVVDDIHMPQVVDLNATEPVAKDEEDEKGAYPFLCSLLFFTF